MYDKKYMVAALKEALKAYYEDEVPVGCVIVKDGKIISASHNEKERRKDVTSHAEILAIKKASEKLNTWNLEGTSMYVTLEPCLMCLGAILDSRIKILYIGTVDTDNGAVVSKYRILGDALEKSKVKYFFKKTISGYILSRFFRKIRKKDS